MIAKRDRGESISDSMWTHAGQSETGNSFLIPTSTPFDVVILGAGLAGVSAAAVLGNQGRRVAIVDPRRTYPPAFKAEKIEPDQAALFRQLGVMEGIAAQAAPIRSIDEAHWGRILRTKTIEEYGIFYQDMVNAVRRQLPASVDQRTARAVEVASSPELQIVKLDNGDELTTRLVAVACGTGGRLHESLGLERQMLREAHSLCTGFDVERVDGRPFAFDSLTYWGDSLREAIDYVTLFPVPGRMRVNMFCFRDPKNPWVRALATNPDETLRRSIPRMSRAIGEWRVTSKVENRVIDLYRVTSAPRNGVVLLGDAFQSVCPSTGTGLSKVLTDVKQLCQVHIPTWLESPGMSAEKIASFYADPVKLEVDRHSLETAEHRRRFGIDPSLRWWVHRRKTFALAAIDGWRNSAAS